LLVELLSASGNKAEGAGVKKPCTTTLAQTELNCLIENNV
jgi:hypothetical protein